MTADDSKLQQRKKFERRGLFWVLIWSATGMTCLSVQGDRVRISKFKVIYSVAILCLLSAAFYRRFQIHRIDYECFITSLVKVYTTCSSLGSSVLIIFLSLIGTRPAVSITKEMISLRNKYTDVSDKSLRSFFHASYLFLWASMIVDFAVFFLGNINSSLFSLVTAYSFFLYSFVFYSQMQFYMKILENGFRYINDCLKSLESVAEERVSSGSHTFREEVTTVEELRDLRVRYHELFVQSERVNSFFSGRVIVAVAHSFVAGVLFTYNGLIEVSNPTSTHFGIPFWGSLFYWAICCFYGLFIMVTPCEKIIQEANNTVIAVQSLSTHPNYTRRFYEEVQHFSSMLILENVKFSPKNFLVLNNPLLMSAFGAVSSSLAILLQIELNNMKLQ